MQELDFKDMKAGVNLHRVVSYGKKLVDNTKVLERIEQLQGQISEIERELGGPLNEIIGIERDIQSKIEDQRGEDIPGEVHGGGRGEEAI